MHWIRKCWRIQILRWRGLSGTVDVFPVNRASARSVGAWFTRNTIKQYQMSFEKTYFHSQAPPAGGLPHAGRRRQALSVCRWRNGRQPPKHNVTPCRGAHTLTEQFRFRLDACPRFRYLAVAVKHRSTCWQQALVSRCSTSRSRSDRSVASAVAIAICYDSYTGGLHIRTTPRTTTVCPHTPAASTAPMVQWP